MNEIDDYENPYTEEETPCSECGEKKIISYFESNGPDDYRKVEECLACGSVWTE